MLLERLLTAFPALSLRSNGMERLLEALNRCWDMDKTLVSDDSINWYHLRYLIKELSATEEQNIIKKCKKRLSPHNDESCLSFPTYFRSPAGRKHSSRFAKLAE